MKRNFAIVLLSVMLLGLLAGCTESYTASDLRDAQKRYYSGSYSRKDEILVTGFNKWRADQYRYTG